MGLFNRKQAKKSSDHDRLHELGKVIKQFMTDPENDNISISFVAGTDEGGMAFIKGDRNMIIQAYSEAYAKNKEFQEVIDTVGNKFNNVGNKIIKGMNPTTVELPDGSKGIALDPDNLTDNQVDNIIQQILKENGLSSNESEG